MFADSIVFSTIDLLLIFAGGGGWGVKKLIIFCGRHKWMTLHYKCLKDAEGKKTLIFTKFGRTVAQSWLWSSKINDNTSICILFRIMLAVHFIVVCGVISIDFMLCFPWEDIMFLLNYLVELDFEETNFC